MADSDEVPGGGGTGPGRPAGAPLSRRGGSTLPSLGGRRGMPPRPVGPPLRRQFRNMGLLLLLSVVVVVAGIAISSRIRPPASLLEVGSHAPPIAPVASGSLPAADQVAGRAGTPFVVEFFGANCPACEAAAPGICTLLAHHPDVTVVAVDADRESPEQIAGYRQSRFGSCADVSRITFVGDPCAATDADGACIDNVTVRWRVGSTPTVYVVDRAGVIAFAGVGSGTPDPADQALTRAGARTAP